MQKNIILSEQQKTFLYQFKEKLATYAPITQATWNKVCSMISFLQFSRNQTVVSYNEIARSMYFICKGAVRAFITDSKGNTYNKNLFLDGDFAGSKASLLQQQPSLFTLEALEDSILISIDYQKFKQLVYSCDDLKHFYISYLEHHWVIEKEQREISLVMDHATKRYTDLLQRHPTIDRRIAQHHIASHLGITPTQLSRIRKELKMSENQHM